MYSLLISKRASFVQQQSSLPTIFLILTMTLVSSFIAAALYCMNTFLVDTVYIKNGTIDSTLYGDYMYAIFNSPE